MLLVAKTCNFFTGHTLCFQLGSLKTQLSEVARSVRWLSDTFRKEIPASPV